MLLKSWYSQLYSSLVYEIERTAELADIQV